MIEVENLHKSFGDKRAVDGLSLSVEKGEVLGVLGPNGAGKSTTMRMVTGYVPATSGRVRIGGLDIVEHPVEAKRMFGYLPENAPSYSEMEVGTFLTFIAAMRGLVGVRGKQAVGKAMETCFLESVRFQSIETLSKGYRHRVGLAQAILHDPDVLILDEPTDGLDPNQKHEVRTLIRSMGQSKAILFSTHILEEVEAACTRVVIIDCGKIVAEGTPAELKSRRAGAVLMALAEGVPAALVAKALGTLEGVAAVRHLGGEAPLLFRIEMNDPAMATAVAKAAGALASKERWVIEELKIEDVRLDDVFRDITSGESRS